MRFALDYSENKVCIDDTKSNQNYYCPYCGATLITKKGDIRQHHFAHSGKHHCTDSWHKSYDLSAWHMNWQKCFPKENQEIKMQLGETAHRADILVGRTVVEFQHSVISAQIFDDRNNFYANLSYKVVWLFDMTQEFTEQKMGVTHQAEQRDQYQWKNPKRVFNRFDLNDGKTDLFFQIREGTQQSIIHILDISKDGIEEFKASKPMNQEDFLNYVRGGKETCDPPERQDQESRKVYQAFLKRYSISLNPQQERALLAVEGANLLLAVPGSGKTTVLVDRLGYMILVKKIPAENILALTYTKNAANEMKTRFIEKFGKEAARGLEFKTINAFAEKVYREAYHRTINTPQEWPHRTILPGDTQKKILQEILRAHLPDEYHGSGEITQYLTHISYAKNMEYSEEQCRALEDILKDFFEVYQQYNKKVVASGQMDYDDQLCLCKKILQRSNYILPQYRKKYRYICVDEAQDTSKIQHSIIQILAEGGNLFMVGDEDQSIYGFRGAYPRALLNFRYDYKNPYILRMEKNYRSRPEIVRAANAFIHRNRGRYEKNMEAAQKAGGTVQKISVENRKAQYRFLLETAKKRQGQMAILYRDNESAVVLMDLFLRKNIPFQLKKPEMNFFKDRVVRIVMAYLKLTTDAYDEESLRIINKTGIIYFDPDQMRHISAQIKKAVPVLDAVEQEMPYVEQRNRESGKYLRELIEAMEQGTTVQAISKLQSSDFQNYLRRSKMDTGKIDLLKMMAEQEPSVPDFLMRIGVLTEEFGKDSIPTGENPVILSTVHSSKGLEYDTVYLVDVYDGKFPSSKPDILFHSKDGENNEQEERRIFYVGMTRAKNHLYILSLNNQKSSYAEEVFGQEQNQAVVPTRTYENTVCRKCPGGPLPIPKKTVQVVKPSKKDIEAEMKAEQQWLESVKDQFETTKKIIRDSRRNRWVKCQICHQIKPAEEFVSYGGMNTPNLGICRECNHKQEKFRYPKK